MLHKLQKNFVRCLVLMRVCSSSKPWVMLCTEDVVIGASQPVSPSNWGLEAVKLLPLSYQVANYARVEDEKRVRQECLGIDPAKPGSKSLLSFHATLV